MVKLVTKYDVSDLPDLFSSQEEADTRMVFHAIKLFAICERIVVRSDVTAVLVLLMYYSFKDMLGPSVYVHAGHTTRVTYRRRYIPITTTYSG